MNEVCSVAIAVGIFPARALEGRSMLDAKLLEQLVSAVAAVLPRTPQDFERNARAALQSVLDRLDLVTREELEVQEAVLARTRARLQILEQHLAALEQKAAPK